MLHVARRWWSEATGRFFEAIRSGEPFSCSSRGLVMLFCSAISLFRLIDFNFYSFKDPWVCSVCTELLHFIAVYSLKDASEILPEAASQMYVESVHGTRNHCSFDKPSGAPIVSFLQLCCYC